MLPISLSCWEFAHVILRRKLSYWPCCCWLYQRTMIERICADVGSDVIYDVDGITFSTNDSFCIKAHHLPHSMTTDRNVKHIFCDMTTSQFNFMWGRGMIFSREMFSDGHTKVIIVNSVECYDQPAQFRMSLKKDFSISQALIVEMEPWNQII